MPKPCKWCNGTNHSSLRCFQRPHKAMRKEAVKTKEKRLTVRELWFKQNPPDKDGYWYCYLNISPQCLIRLTEATVVLEHDISKARDPSQKYIVKNIKPACNPCNKLKGSLSAKEAVSKYSSP